MTTDRSLTAFEDSFDEHDLDPLDCVEEIMERQNWTYERTENDQIIIEVKGQFCSYKIHFIWEEDMNAMQFCAQYGFNMHISNKDYAAQTLMQINQRLWMGHFEIPYDTNIPAFRYTCLLGGTNYERRSLQFGEILEIAMTQCERFYPAFHLLATPDAANDKTLPLALMETKGVS